MASTKILDVLPRYSQVQQWLSANGIWTYQPTRVAEPPEPRCHVKLLAETHINMLGPKNFSCAKNTVENFLLTWNLRCTDEKFEWNRQKKCASVRECVYMCEQAKDRMCVFVCGCVSVCMTVRERGNVLKMASSPAVWALFWEFKNSDENE